MSAASADQQRLGGQQPSRDAGHTTKRPRKTSPEPSSVSQTGNDVSSGIHLSMVDTGGVGGNPWLGANATFRSLSTCNRCRLRKHRCDQRLPICSGCEKAGTRCTGYDPVLKREVPRSYVYFLENRVAYLESLLENHHISFDSPDPGYQNDGPIPGKKSPQKKSEENTEPPPPTLRNERPRDTAEHVEKQERGAPVRPKIEERTEDTIDDLVDNVGLVSVQGTSSSRYLGSTSGMSFARVVFAAIKSSVNTSSGSDNKRSRHGRQLFPTKTTDDPTSMRDSFFGLQDKPAIKQAPFPDRETGQNLVDIFFEHANPMYPILHREEFLAMFDNAYSSSNNARTPRELYLLNIVFAVGKAIFLTSGKDGRGVSHNNGSQDEQDEERGTGKRKRAGEVQAEEYHASAAVHLESVLGSHDGIKGGLEELQAVLLLAMFAILRPVPPGLWYIIGVAVRLAVDLGLHQEDDAETEEEDMPVRNNMSEAEKGRREYIRDMRRRLWWCVYSFDRLVSGCVGRPVGISDQVITTEFPSLLDDKYITKAGLSPEGEGLPSYKHAAHHYFGLRLLQSEVIEVLQHQHAWQSRARRAHTSTNAYLTAHLSHPFLENFTSFRSWRADIDQRLQEWMERTPTQRETAVQFSLEFFELNYWLTIVMLYRQSLSIPPQFEGEFSTADEVGSPSMYRVELQEDKDMVFLRVAEAGRKVLRLYRQLHHKHLFNYTYLDTHHLFMSGIAYLYAIWHSPTVRSRLTMEDVDFTVLAATSVLGDLIEKCPPAEACRDAFKRMSNATIQMCLSSTGFGADADADVGFDSNNGSDGDGFDSPLDHGYAGPGPGPPMDENPWVQVSYDHRQHHQQRQPPTSGVSSRSQDQRQIPRTKIPPPSPSHSLDEISPLTTFSRPVINTNTTMGPPPSSSRAVPTHHQQQRHHPHPQPPPSFEGLDFLREVDNNSASASNSGTGVSQMLDPSGLDPSLGLDLDLEQGFEMDWDSVMGAGGVDGTGGGAGGHDFGTGGGHMDPFDGFFFGGGNGH